VNPFPEYSIQLSDGFHLIFELRYRSGRHVVWVTGIKQPNAEP